MRTSDDLELTGYRKTGRGRQGVFTFSDIAGRLTITRLRVPRLELVLGTRLAVGRFGAYTDPH